MKASLIRVNKGKSKRKQWSVLCPENSKRVHMELTLNGKSRVTVNGRCLYSAWVWNESSTISKSRLSVYLTFVVISETTCHNDWFVPRGCLNVCNAVEWLCILTHGDPDLNSRLILVVKLYLGWSNLIKLEYSSWSTYMK